MITPTIEDFQEGFKYLVRGMDVKNWSDAREYTYPELPFNGQGKDLKTYVEKYLQSDKIRSNGKQ